MVFYSVGEFLGKYWEYIWHTDPVCIFDSGVNRRMSGMYDECGFRMYNGSLEGVNVKILL